LLLTGVRTGSLIKAEWKEIDFDNNLWTIPPDHLKLKKTEAQKPHKVHLTGFIKDLFKELKELSGCGHVIPSRDSTEDDSNPANDKLFSRVINRSRGNIEGIKENFNAHDFRTTFSISMADMGIAPHITELALEHKLPKIMATYNKHEYLDERKDALEQWSDKIEMLVTNKNVVVLQTQTN
jgi:integrase